MNSLSEVQGFLGLTRVAIAGVSRNPKDFTRAVFREFVQRGYDAVPVNPNTPEIDGVRCFPSVEQVTPPVEGLLLMTRPDVTREVVKECARTGIRRIWMFRGGGIGAVDSDAVQFCADQGIGVVAGECPFMFFPENGFIHRVHGFCRKVLGHYPQ